MYYLCLCTLTTFSQLLLPEIPHYIALAVNQPQSNETCDVLSSLGGGSDADLTCTVNEYCNQADCTPTFSSQASPLSNLQLSFTLKLLPCYQGSDKEAVGAVQITMFSMIKNLLQAPTMKPLYLFVWCEADYSTICPHNNYRSNCRYNLQQKLHCLVCRHPTLKDWHTYRYIYIYTHMCNSSIKLVVLAIHACRLYWMNKVHGCNNVFSGEIDLSVATVP